MRALPGDFEVLFLSALPPEFDPDVRTLRGQGLIVRVASRPAQALACVRRRPRLVFVDLVHGPGLDPRVVKALNRFRRTTRVVALHQGRIDSHLDQVEHLRVDGFCRLSEVTAPGSDRNRHHRPAREILSARPRARL